MMQDDNCFEDFGYSSQDDFCASTCGDNGDDAIGDDAFGDDAYNDDSVLGFNQQV